MIAIEKNGVKCHAIQFFNDVEKQSIDMHTADIENAPAPVVFYNFETGSGTDIEDRSESGTDHDATVEGDADWDASAKAAGSYSLECGANGCAEIADHTDLDWDYNDQWTVSAYAAQTTASYAGIYCKRLSGAGSTAYRGIAIFSVNGNIEVYIVSHYGTVGVDDRAILVKGTGTSTDINDGAFYHVVVAYDGSTNASGVTVWIDGVIHTIANGKLVVGSSHDTLTTDTTTNSSVARVGTDTVAAAFTCDNVDNFAAFSTELSSTQVAALYNSGTPIDVARGL